MLSILRPPARRLGWLFWNGGEARLRALWRFFLFGALVTASFRLVGVTGLAPGPGSQTLAAVAWPLLIQASAVLLCTRYLDRQSLAELGVRPSPVWLRDLLFGLGLGALLMAFVFLAEWTSGMLVVNDRARLDRAFAQGWFANLAAMVAVGCYEELVARGYLLRNLAQALSTTWLAPRLALALACFCSSALFGLGHFNNPNATIVSTVNVALAGALLALPYLLTGRLALSIGLHVTWNFFQGCVFGLPVSGLELSPSLLSVKQVGSAWLTGGAFGPEGGLIGLLAMAAGAGLLLLWARHTEGQLALYQPLAQARRRVGERGLELAPVALG